MVGKEQRPGELWREGIEEKEEDGSSPPPKRENRRSYAGPRLRCEPLATCSRLFLHRRSEAARSRVILLHLRGVLQVAPPISLSLTRRSDLTKGLKLLQARFQVVIYSYNSEEAHEATGLLEECSDALYVSTPPLQIGTQHKVRMDDYAAVIEDFNITPSRLLVGARQVVASIDLPPEEYGVPVEQLLFRQTSSSWQFFVYALLRNGVSTSGCTVLCIPHLTLSPSKDQSMIDLAQGIHCENGVWCVSRATEVHTVAFQYEAQRGKCSPSAEAVRNFAGPLVPIVALPEVKIEDNARVEVQSGVIITFRNLNPKSESRAEENQHRLLEAHCSCPSELKLACGVVRWRRCLSQKQFAHYRVAKKGMPGVQQDRLLVWVQ